LKQWLNNHFGTRRGFIETMKYRILYRFGIYNEYKHVNFQEIERLVFVCKGNICRSAFAEVVARQLNFEATSYGIDTVNGKSANEMAIRVAAGKGFDLSGHKTKSINTIELKHGDLLIAMEPSQVTFLKEIISEAGALTLMGLWASPTSPHIQDPFGASIEYFNYCFDYIEKSVAAITNKIDVAKPKQGKCCR